MDHSWGGAACCPLHFNLRNHLQNWTCVNTLYAMQSRIFRGLLQPLLTVTAIATAVATWETLREVTPV